MSLAPKNDFSCVAVGLPCKWLRFIRELRYADRPQGSFSQPGFTTLEIRWRPRSSSPKISAFPVRRSELPVSSGKFLKNGMISVEFGRFW